MPQAQNWASAAVTSNHQMHDMHMHRSFCRSGVTAFSRILVQHIIVLFRPFRRTVPILSKLEKEKVWDISKIFTT